MRMSQRAIQRQREHINGEQVVLMTLIGYDKLTQGEEKFTFQNKWYGIKREGKKHIAIRYWRSGDHIDTVLESVIKRRVDKLTAMDRAKEAISRAGKR